MSPPAVAWSALEPYRKAVAAGVGAALKAPGLHVDSNPLSAADTGRPRRDDRDVVASIGQRLPDVDRKTLLYLHVPGREAAEARGLDGFLDVHAEIEHIGQELRRRLKDSLATRGAHADVEFLVQEGLCRGDHEVDPFGGPDLVRAALLEVEPVAHVVQEDARVAHRHGRAESAAQGLRYRHDVAVAVGCGEVCGHAAVELLRAPRPERLCGHLPGVMLARDRGGAIAVYPP